MAQNPMTAYRKSQKKKQQAKNKAHRDESNKLRTAKKDPRELQAEIARLEKENKAGTLDADGKNSLTSAKAELERILKTKKDFVAAHPEQAHLAFPNRANKNNNNNRGAEPADQAGLFTADGKLRNPERSIYYDPVFNPYGVPPPGQPLILKPEPEEQSSEEDDEDDIAMPEGPPPSHPNDNSQGSSDDGSNDDSDDDIPMPSGPQPPKQELADKVPINPPLPPGPPPVAPQFLGPTNYQQYRQQQRPHNQRQPQPHRPQPQSQSQSQSQSQQLPPHPPHLPPKPTTASQESRAITTSTTTPTTTSHVISAEPQLRNLHKEATAFVPAAVKRQQKQKQPPPPPLPPGGIKVNATTGDNDDDDDGQDVKRFESKTSLLGALSDVGFVQENQRKRQKLSDDLEEV